MNSNQMNSPIIVVGRPRSGSTLFSRLLNEGQNLCVLNDLYYLQYVDSLGGFSRQDDTLLQNLAKQILLLLKDRQQRDESGIAGIEFGHFLDAEKTEKLEAFAEQCLQQGDHNWSSLFGSIMQYNAQLFGKDRWSYNTPQDYLHLSRLQSAFPDAKFIFVMRDPRAVLLSYKYVDYLEGYHDPARYHPILQAIAWKSAIDSYFEHQNQDNILLVKYVDLLRDVNQVMAEVNEFTGVKFPPINLKDFGNNSTFKNKVKNKLTNTEIWLCEKIVGKEMQQLGYTLKNCRPSILDLKDTLYVTNRALMFYLKQSIASNDIRKRVLTLAKTRLT